MKDLKMTVTVLYVGSSLLGPLRQAEGEINRRHAVGLRLAAHNFGAPLDLAAWAAVERDLSESEVVFVIHVTDGENAARLIPLLKECEGRTGAVVVINCMPELMRRTRMGKLRFGEKLEEDQASEVSDGRARRLLRGVGNWMGEQARARRGGKGASQTSYLRLVERVPRLLRFLPGAGRLRDVKHYLYLFCYFLQPTPSNVRSMLLYALKHYGGDPRLKTINIPPPESVPAVGVYHPDAPAVFPSFADYRKWYAKRARRAAAPPLDAERTIGLLLMRTNVVSGTRAHYDGLIRRLEAEGLAVLPIISTFMDNREACREFFVAEGAPRVSQLVSLTGFSFVGGPAMNDSEAAVEFLSELNRPLRSAVSLDTQTVEAWRDSWTGLNPVQTGMQVAIPEIDGATEPFVFGGMTVDGAEPVAIEERCGRLARRLRRWNRLRTTPRNQLRLALVLFCFPPNKGNIGTAADLDVFPSLLEILRRLRAEGYAAEVPASADELRERLTGGNSEEFGAVANVAYRMPAEEYTRLCPYARDIEREWGPPPGRLNSFGRDLLVHGLPLGNVFVGVQPTFGYEGDPMRLLMSRGGAPHHGFAALYTYLDKIFGADAVVHTGTHGALEFMPGKQVGLSGACWPDRLIGELPHVYIYSVNNPSEGTIARRRSHAGLVSYLTPPVEDAGLYGGLASLKELLLAYRQSEDEHERRRLFHAIEEQAGVLHL